MCDLAGTTALDSRWRAPGHDELKRRIAEESWLALPLEDKEKWRQLLILEGDVAEGKLLPETAAGYAEVVHAGGSIFGLPLDDTPASRAAAKKWAEDRLADYRLMAAHAAVGQQNRMAPGDEETEKAVERVKHDPETQELVDQLRAEIRSRRLQEARRASSELTAPPASEPVRVVPRAREHGAGPVRRHRSQQKRDDGDSESDPPPDQPLVVAFGSNGDGFRLLAADTAAGVRRWLHSEIDRRRRAALERPELSVTRPAVPERPCEVCGRMFTPLRRSNARLCSKACKQRAYRLRLRKAAA